MKRDVTAGEEKNLELWKKEVKVMVDLDHHRIVKLRDFDSQAFMEKFNGKKVPVVFLALEFVENGELFTLLGGSEPFKEEYARLYFSQILEGI